MLDKGARPATNDVKTAEPSRLAEQRGTGVAAVANEDGPDPHRQGSLDIAQEDLLQLVLAVHSALLPKDSRRCKRPAARFFLRRGLRPPRPGWHRLWSGRIQQAKAPSRACRRSVELGRW